MGPFPFAQHTPVLVAFIEGLPQAQADPCGFVLDLGDGLVNKKGLVRASWKGSLAEAQSHFTQAEGRAVVSYQPHQG